MTFPKHGGTKLGLFLMAAVLGLTRLSMTAQTMTGEQQRARQTALALSQEAARLETDNRWAEALPLRVKLTTILTEAFGETSPQTDQGRGTLGKSLAMLGRYAEARAVWERCLAARTSALGDRHERVADAWLHIGETFRREGQLTNALVAYAQAEQIAAVLADAMQLRATVANNQALVLVAQGNLVAAEQHFTNALGCLASLSNANPHEVATVLSGLGDTRRALGRFVEAEADLDRACSLLSDLPPHTPARMLTESHLALVLQQQGRSLKAIAIYERIIPLIEGQRPPEDLEVLGLRRDWAVALARQQDHARALQIINDCLGRLQGTRHTETPLYFALQMDQADRLADLGDTTGAAMVYEKLLVIPPQTSVAVHSLLWTAKERSAIIARSQGDFNRARDLLAQVLAYRRQQAAGSSRSREELTSTLLEWARCQRVLGRVDEADQALQEARQLIRQHLSLAHPLAGEMMTEAGFLAQAQGRPDLALRSHRDALGIRLQAGSEYSLPAAESRLNIADLLARQGQLEAAMHEFMPAYNSINTIAAPGSPLTTIAEFNLASLQHRAGDLKEAARHYEAALAATQRQRVRHLQTVARDLAFLELDRTNAGAALRYAKLAASQQEEQWRNVLRFSSETDRLAWRGSEDVFSLLAAVADRDPLPLAQAVLQFKGVVLDSTIEDAQLLAQQADPGVGTQVAALRAAKTARLRLELMAQSRSAAVDEPLRAIRRETEQLESALAARVAALGANRQSWSASVELIQKALPSDAVLVEFLRYERWLGRGATEPWYAAMILAKTGPPQWCPLGSATTNGAIAKAVAAWQDKVHQKVPPEGDAAIEPLRTLHDQVWEPIARFRPESARTIIVSPDGDLNFVSFAALWATNHFLGEGLTFRYVASGRDLLNPAYVAPREKRFCIVAAPEYARPGWQRATTNLLTKALAACNVLALRGGTGEDLLPLCADLPNTRLEAESLATLARQNGLQVTPPLLGKAATETALRACAAPYVLHLATHGRFLSDAVLARAQGLVPNQAQVFVPRLPMHRSWVALARANETLEAWRQDKVPDPLTDGLLTADEAARLPLQGTWLVNLSACDTGLGVGRSGEGVFGLRRGFTSAGARHVLMTLWPVQDDRTLLFMEAFYRDALQSKDAASAVGRTQRRLLMEWREAEGPVRAARFAGAFVLTSRGL